MTTTKIPQAHDLFFKVLLSRPERAGTLLWENLPEEIAMSLSEKLPELVPGSFVEERLRAHRSDRLYRVETVNGKTAFLYVLIEHKSTPDEKVGWQLLKYMGEILRQWEKDNPDWKYLPAIVPFVFYHGAEAWKTPNEFLHLVDAEEAWRPYLLNFRFPVLDLGKIPDKELSEDRRLYPWLLVMKYATRTKQQMTIKELLVEALRAVPEELRPILHYLIQTYVYDEQTLRGIIREVQPEEEEKMISQFAQEIERKALLEGRQKGLLEGEARGEARGEAKLLLRQLFRRFQPLPNEISERVHGADPNTLEIWGDRVLDAKSLDEVFME